MESTEQVVRRLIGSSAVAVLRVRTGSGDFSVEARLSKEGSREGSRGIWVRLAGGDPGLIDRLIAASTPVLAGTDDGPRRVTFVTSFLARRRGLLAGEQVLLAWPGELKSQERRRAERERIPPGSELGAWLTGAGSTTFARVQPAQVWDLSTDGACLICPTAAAGKCKRGDELEIQLRFGGADYRLAARVCRTESVAGAQVRLGIQFIPGESASAVTGPLAELVEELRSQRVRRGLNRALVKGA